MKAIAIANSKGGVGKTTLAVNLAARAAMGHIKGVDPAKRILIFDMDGQQNTSTIFLQMQQVGGESFKQIPLHPDYNPEDMDDDWLGRSSSTDIYYDNDVVPYPTVFDRLDILPANGDQLTLFEDLAGTSNPDLLETITTHFKRFVDGADVREEYDLLIFDTPPGINFITIPVFRACSHVIVPVVPEPLAMDGVSGVIRAIKKENQYRNEPVQIAGIVANKVSSNLNIHKENLARLRNDPETAVYFWENVISSRTKFKLEGFPLSPESYIYNDKKAEKEMATFIEDVERHVYGADPEQASIVDIEGNGAKYGT